MTINTGNREKTPINIGRRNFGVSPRIAWNSSISPMVNTAEVVNLASVALQRSSVFNPSSDQRANRSPPANKQNTTIQNAAL